MKKVLIPTALILASGIAIAGSESFTLLDINQDGALSQEEAAAVQGLDFSAADQDGNAALSQDEFMAVTGGSQEGSQEGAQ